MQSARDALSKLLGAFNASKRSQFFLLNPIHSSTFIEVDAFVLLSFIRVHKLFLYDDDLKKEAKFSFGHFITHRSPQTGKHDMKVR